MVSQDPLISVIIPTYNRAHYIGEAIKSVLAQDYEKFELIVVDDGSTDNTEEVVKTFGDERIRYIKKEHSKTPATRNRGIKEANGEFILWVGSDDVILPGLFSRHIEVLQEYPQVDVFYGDVVGTDDKLNEKMPFSFADWYGKSEDLISFQVLGNRVPDGGSLIRTSCYDEFGVYDESFLRAHDYQWWSRVCGKINFKHIGGCYYKWRWHDENITGYDQEKDRSYEARTAYGMLSLYPLKSLFPDAGWGFRPENEAEAVSYLKAANAIGKWKDGEEVQKCIGQVIQRVSRQRAMELMEELGKEEMAKESEAFSNEDGKVKTGRGAKDDAYYDRIYEDSEQYHSDYKVSHYYEMWTQVLQLLRMVQEPRVLEIGCGTGQLAHYLYDEGFRHYHGFDFSEEAVRIASQRVPQSFCVADARAPETFDHNYNAVICLEVLEHVDDDLGILSNIHEGAAVILSVPSSDDPAHFRFFLAKDSVTRRYSAVLDIQEIVQIDRWFVCLGVKLPAVD